MNPRTVKLIRPQGKHQRAIWAKVKRQPQNSYPMPQGALRAAVHRLVEKGFLVIESSGQRYRIAR